MVKRKDGNFRGILNPQEGWKNFQLARYLPSDDLCFFVEHYWTVKWDLRGRRPYTQEILPHPSMHLTIEKDSSEIVGVIRGISLHPLKGKGEVFAVRFRAGGFYPFVHRPASTFTDTMVGIRRVFGAAGKALEATVLKAKDDETRVAITENFLRARLPERDPNVTRVNQIIDRIMTDRDITQVEDVARQCHVSKRTLQRLFNQYVGVSPKWVIRLYRLHEATDRLAAGRPVDLAKLAVELGYTDQAHFIKDFKAIIGKSPATYARKNS